nr:ERF family protein [uncultured Leptotrichia sp.]
MLNEKIIKIKNKFYETEIKKSGKNKMFQYFELKDFLPNLVKLMAEEEVNDVFTIDNDFARLKLIHKDEVNEYTIPFVMFDVPVTSQGKDSMQKIQYLGALSTYYKRYLYMNAFSITENDKIDAMDNSELGQNEKTESKKKKAKEEKRESRENYIARNTQKYFRLIDNFLKANEVESVSDLTYEKVGNLAKTIFEKEKNREGE